MRELTVTRDELEELGRKLDAAGLSEKDRRVLLAVFTIAGDTLVNEEVSAFSLAPGATLGHSLSDGLPLTFGNAFVAGPRGESDPVLLLPAI